MSAELGDFGDDDFGDGDFGDDDFGDADFGDAIDNDANFGADVVAKNLQALNVLALDLGLKRIGVAISRQSVPVALDAILRHSRNQAAKAVQSLLKDYDIDILVVGIPLGGSSEAEMKRRITHFMSLVLDTSFKGKENFKLIYEDESLTSKEAASINTGPASKKRSKSGQLDSLSALLILQNFLDKNTKT